MTMLNVLPFTQEVSAPRLALVLPQVDVVALQTLVALKLP